MRNSLVLHVQLVIFIIINNISKVQIEFQYFKLRWMRLLLTCENKILIKMIYGLPTNLSTK